MKKKSSLKAENDKLSMTNFDRGRGRDRRGGQDCGAGRGRAQQLLRHGDLQQDSQVGPLCLPGQRCGAGGQDVRGRGPCGSRLSG